MTGPRTFKMASPGQTDKRDDGDRWWHCQCWASARRWQRVSGLRKIDERNDLGDQVLMKADPKE